MMLSEFKDEEALDLLADILEPVGMILDDEEISKIYKEADGKTGIAGKLKIAKVMIKNHKPEVIEILARLDGCKDVKDYHCTVFSLPKQILTILNDPLLSDFFTSQAQNAGEMYSGPVTENTGEADET